jgi:CDP-2,3-bis-(O-geranylgeranyl)-sn-glycerol synthase
LDHCLGSIFDDRKTGSQRPNALTRRADFAADVPNGIEMTASRVLELVYLMLPAYAANMAPPFVKFWPGWNPPINHALFGDHKTVVGFALGVVVGIFVAFIQSRIGWSQSILSASNWLAIGLAAGFGAMLGDSIKSFAKRRVGIAPGSPWIPADQLDFAVGALVLMFPVIRLGWMDVAAIVLITFAGDIAVNHVSFWLGIRTTKW